MTSHAAGEAINTGLNQNTVLEDYNPIHALGKETLGKDWPLEGGDYLSLFRAGLCSIPVVGAFVDAGFSIIWGKLFPAVDENLKKAEFEKRMKQLIKDVEVMIGKSIDEEVRKWCEAKFQALCDNGNEFRKLELICMDFVNKKQQVDDNTKRHFAGQYQAFGNALREALVFFSRPDKIQLTIKIYLQTAIFYIAFLRDSLIYAKEWGLPDKYITGTSDGRVKPLATYIGVQIAKVTNNYYYYYKNTGRTDFISMVAQFLYADPGLYDRQQGWIKAVIKKDGMSNRHVHHLPDIKTPFTAIFDGSTLVPMGGGYIDLNNVQFTTGSSGMHHLDFIQLKKASWYTTVTTTSLKDNIRVRVYWEHPEGVVEKAVEKAETKAPLVGNALGKVGQAISKVPVVDAIGKSMGGYGNIECTIRELPQKDDGYFYDETPKIILKEQQLLMDSTYPPAYGSYINVNRIVMSETKPFKLAQSKTFTVIVYIPIQKTSMFQMEIICDKSVKDAA